MLAGTTKAEQTAGFCASTWLECAAAGLFGWEFVCVLMFMGPLSALLNSSNQPEQAPLTHVYTHTHIGRIKEVCRKRLEMPGCNEDLIVQ